MCLQICDFLEKIVARARKFHCGHEWVSRGSGAVTTFMGKLSGMELRNEETWSEHSIFVCAKLFYAEMFKRIFYLMDLIWWTII